MAPNAIGKHRNLILAYKRSVVREIRSSLSETSMNTDQILVLPERNCKGFERRIRNQSGLVGLQNLVDALESGLPIGNIVLKEVTDQRWNMFYAYRPAYHIIVNISQRFHHVTVCFI